MPTLVRRPRLGEWEQRADRHIRTAAITFDAIVARARARQAAGDLEEAAFLCQVAADFAWFHPTGRYVSVELEEAIEAIAHGSTRAAGSGFGEESATPARRPDESVFPVRILHVLTHAYEVGGHTRVVWRWIENDAARTHDVALTDQADRPVPARLRRAVEKAAGTLHRVDTGGGGILEGARALRELAGAADLVVLHTHPFDVAAAVALSGPRPAAPVSLFNHADHVFWVGRSAADLVIHFRESAVTHGRRRRGIAAERAAVLPLPVEGSSRIHSREDAKHRLGLPQGATVLLSIASEYKVAPVAGTDFASLHAEIVRGLPDALFLVVGPEPNRRWREATARAGGRLQALGALSDVRLHLEAADVYVDTFPLSSTTSVLDAGSLGTPVVSFDPFDGTAGLLRTDDPAVPDAWYRTADAERYGQTLAELVTSRAARDVRGRELATAIAALHDGAGWREQLGAVYEKALRSRKAAAQWTAPPKVAPDLADRVLCEIHRDAGMARGIEGSFSSHRRHIPPRARWRYLVGSVVLGRPFSAWRLLRGAWKRTCRRALGSSRRGPAIR